MMVSRAGVVVLLAGLSACTSTATLGSDTSALRATEAPTTSPTLTTPDPPTTAPTTPDPTTARPAWLGQRILDTDENGFARPVDTPPELIGRAFATIDTLPPPPSLVFESTIVPLRGAALARSTWNDSCPVAVGDLAYLTVSFWGFDQTPHTGELIVHADSGDDIVTVFRTLFDAKYPIEEMRIVTGADLDAPPTGDTNNTGSFACRLVQGTGTFSEHAYGRAIDVNPFHNPLVRGDLVLPELAGFYVDRSVGEEALIGANSVVVGAFASIGWSWGGDWSSLKDYQHFSSTGQ